MFRRLLFAFAVLEALVPERIVAFGERMAFGNPGEATLRPWTVPIARAEGVAFALLAVRGDLSHPAVRGLLGTIGLPALLTPDRLVDWGLWVAYEDADTVKVRSWVVPATRILGIVYVLVAVFGGRRRADKKDR